MDIFMSISLLGLGIYFATMRARVFLTGEPGFGTFEYLRANAENPKSLKRCEFDSKSLQNKKIMPEAKTNIWGGNWSSHKQLHRPDQLKRSLCFNSIR